MSEKKQIVDAYKLLGEQNFEEALALLDELIQKNQNDFNARFTRAFVKFIYLKEESEEVINDFEFLVSKNTAYTPKSLAFLSIIYCHLGEYTLSIQKGTDQRCDPSDFNLDFYFSLSKSFFLSDKLSYLNEALMSIDKCIEEEPNEFSEFYYCKVDILNTLGDFENAFDILEIAYTKYGGSLVHYLSAAQTCICEYVRTNDKNALEKAKDNIIRAKQYDEENTDVKMISAEIEAKLGNVDEAVKIIDTATNVLGEELALIEKFKVYSQNDLKKRIEEEALSFLKSHQSWKILVLYASYCYDKVNSKEDAQKKVDILNQAFKLNPSIYILSDLDGLNFVLNKEEETLEKAKEIEKEEGNNPDFNYIVASNMHVLNYDYDIIASIFYKAFGTSLISDVTHIGLLADLLENPTVCHMGMKKMKYAKALPESFSVWDRKRMASRFFFGEDGIKEDLKKAKLFYESAYKDGGDNPCVKAAYAYYLENLGENDEAFKLYVEAYNKSLEKTFISCNCTAGYLAHAYTKGIGTKQDLDKAKQIVLDSLNDYQGKSCNTIIYLYTYFALQNDERFDLLKAKEMLKLTFPFRRYEITRAMMQKIIAKKLGEDTLEFDKLIKKCLTFSSKHSKKFFKENKNKDLIYIAKDHL